MTDASADPPADRDFTRVGQSPIEGTGVFAKRAIPRGTRIFEYTGARRTLTALLTDPALADAPSTYLFRLNDSIIIDGAVDGSDARFVNHGCDPNCEAHVFDDRLYIYAMRDIVEGEELTFDYQLTPWVEAEDGDEIEGGRECRCGAPTCRGTMRAERRRSAQ